MTRKGESLTLSISPGTREMLEQLAVEHNCLWGNKPNVSAFVEAIAGKAYWIALIPFVAYVGVKPVNDLVSSASFIKQIWDLNPLKGFGKVELSELDDKQKQVASDIIATGKEMNMSKRDIKIALMTAQQESGLRNLDHGDDWYFAQTGGGKSDSVGVFQQRDSWGDRTCRTEVKCSAKLFYSALQKNSDRDSKKLWEAAADVQRPAAEYRQHYAQWEGLSDRIIKSTEQTKGAKAFPIEGQSWATAEKTSPYGDRSHPLTGISKTHWGQDLAAPSGTPLVATESGTVQDIKDSLSGCGKELTIMFQDKTGVRYCHLSEVLVKDGQEVKAGDRVGKVGATGGVTGAHLHFERIEDGKSVEPIEYLKS
jgi:Peptidase family M23